MRTADGQRGRFRRGAFWAVAAVVAGLVLFTSIPIRYEHSLWFRFKLILLFAAAVNAILLHRYMKQSVSTWDTDKVPPRRARIGGGLSLCLWFAIVFYPEILTTVEEA